MSGTKTKLTAAAEEYFSDLRRIRASGAATPERSLYGPLGNLLKAVGTTLKPKVFSVQEPADLGFPGGVTTRVLARRQRWPARRHEAVSLPASSTLMRAFRASRTVSRVAQLAP